jgi:hypothetical protein
MWTFEPIVKRKKEGYKYQKSSVRGEALPSRLVCEGDAYEFDYDLQLL